MTVHRKQVQGLLDSGCSQTVAQASMVGSDTTLKNTIHLQCIYRDVNTYPSLQLQLMVGAPTVVITVALAEKLAYPLVVG